MNLWPWKTKQFLNQAYSQPLGSDNRPWHECSKINLTAKEMDAESIVVHVEHPNKSKPLLSDLVAEFVGRTDALVHHGKQVQFIPMTSRKLSELARIIESGEYQDDIHGEEKIQ